MKNITKEYVEFIIFSVIGMLCLLAVIQWAIWYDLNHGPIPSPFNF